MKQLLYIMIGIVWCLSSCKEMDSIYEEYIIPNGIIYPGKALNPIVYAGKNRVKISWLKGADPKVVKARIYWNNYTDSVNVDVPANQDTISVILENLPENTYSFFIRTFDGKGNVSVPVEVIGTSYGERYQAGILNRAINNAIITGTTIKVDWGTIDTLSAYATEVRYTNAAGELETLYAMSNQSVSTITDIKKGTTFLYRTLYVPNHLAIDTFYTNFIENTEYLIDRNQMSVLAFSSAHPGVANEAKNAIDWNPDTRWHTHATSSRYPHFIIVDMKKEWIISGFKIFRMTNDDRACNTFQLLVSTDNITWVDLGVFNFNRLTNEGQYYGILSHPLGRYFKFVGLTGPQAFMVIGDISVYGL